MKKNRIGIIAGVAMLLSGLTAAGQNTNCLGLKNPSNFVMTGGAANSRWVGSVGIKSARASTCTQLGHDDMVTVQAAALESTPTTGGSYCTSPASSYDINGVDDRQKRFVIKGSGVDLATVGHLSYLPPDTSYHTSIRVGNYCGNHEAEQLTYQFRVNNNNNLITIWYAMSLQNGRHTAAQNPEFVLLVEKATTDQNGNITGWTLAGHDTLCYMRPTPTSSDATTDPFLYGSTGQTGPSTTATYGHNIYLPWNKVLVNLERLYGQYVRIRIGAGDCSMTAHYAYCYIAGDCQSLSLSVNACAAGSSNYLATISAPSGASTYRWFRSRSGVLQGADRTNESNYIEITGAMTDTLRVLTDHFRNGVGDTLDQNSFMCKMTTYMNESLPVESTIFTEVGNTKPTLGLDSILYCDGTVRLTDRSFARFIGNNDSNKVDTTHTKWKFYRSSQPLESTFLDSIEGGTASYQYDSAGTYCVTVRSQAFKSSCWNEKTVQIRVIKPPVPRIELSRNNLCKGDTIAIMDRTERSVYSKWDIHLPEGDTTYESRTRATTFAFNTTTRISLTTHTNTHFDRDTNYDGVVDQIYCDAKLDTTIFVQDYPKVIATGDTIVCNGTQSVVNVSSNESSAKFDWYTSMNSSNALQMNTRTLTTTPTRDIRYYVKGYTSFGCTAWDSINIYIVDPHLQVPVKAVCDDTPVTLYATNAYRYTWSAMPDDPSLVGKEHDDTLVVTPHRTTTYTLVGHGMNDCTTAPLTEQITVYPYPTPSFEMSPNFIDSEKPEVTFKDVSEGSTSSLWNFGNGNTSTDRQVRHTFTDLSQDSVEVSLTTANELNCESDTSFWVPIELFSVWFPNAFTPTLGTNRTFGVYTHNTLEYYSLYIYNRNGQLIFYTTDQTAEWDGRYKDKICDQGVYTYVCTYRRPGTVDIATQKGTVVLLQ